MNYKYIPNSKLRVMMESARRSRRFVSVESDKKSIAINSNRMRVKNKRIRKQYKKRVISLQTYIDKTAKEIKEKKVGKMPPKRRPKSELRKPRSMVGRRLKPPPTKDLAVATKQLSSMIRTGLPLLEALNIISETSENTTIKFVFKEVASGISKGATMSDILDKYKEVFDEMYRALVSAGEIAGLLPDTLDREAQLLESLSKIKAQIKSAMTYPIAIFVLTMIVVVLMLIFVIPIFVGIYANSSAPLPAITQILVDASNQLKTKTFYYKAVPTCLAIWMSYKYLSKRSIVLWWYDRTLIFLPITKDLVTKSCLANFSRTLSSLNTAGVPLLESLEISKRTITNRVFKRIIEKMYKDIQVGNPIYRVLEQEEVVPIMFTSMFRIGEETGELSQMITKLADFYEDEVSASVKALTSIMEPLLIIFVAIIVCFMLVAMYLPMFSMMSIVD